MGVATAAVVEAVRCYARLNGNGSLATTDRDEFVEL